MGKMWRSIQRALAWAIRLDTLRSWLALLPKPVWFAVLTIIGACVGWLQHMTLAGGLLFGAIIAFLVMATVYLALLAAEKVSAKRKYGVDDLKGWSVSANLGIAVLFIRPPPHSSMIGFQGSRFVNLSSTQARHIDLEIHYPGPNGEDPVILRGPDARETEYRKGVKAARPDDRSRSHDAIELPITLAPGAIIEGQVEFEMSPLEWERVGMHVGPDMRPDMPEATISMTEFRSGRTVNFKRSECYDAAVDRPAPAPPIRLGPGTHTLARIVVPKFGDEESK
jgi:hypothetical protein